MGGKSSSKIEVNRYHMSLHLGICLGPVDAITAAYYGEKKYWNGYTSVNQAYRVSNTGLFGGDKKEGGVEGTMTFLMGRSDQLLPDDLARKLGRSSGLDCPGFRGITSVFHTGSSGRGWYWAANSPYLKNMWYTVVSVPKKLGLEYAKVNEVEGSGDPQFVGAEGYSLRTGNALLMPLTTGARSLSELLSEVDRLNPTGAPHAYDNWADRFVPSNCIVNPSNADANGYVRAEVPGDGFQTALKVIYADGDFGQKVQAYVVESFFLGVGKNTTGGQSVRPVTPLLEVLPRQGTCDANPAHIIYEVMTNTEYGMGLDPVAINTQSFESAARVLFDEGLGLSMAWSTTTPAGDFIDEIAQHINALVFPDPETGKITLKLVRPEYDESTLRSVNPDNGTITNFSRKAWGDTINEIVVTWTNPATEQEETVTLQDNGNIAEQGEVISDTKNYYGVRSANLAWTLAARDLRVASAPLCSAEIDLDRSFWNIRPGDCLKVSWPEYGMVGLVMRVWEVKYGNGSRNSKIVVSVTEDIFSLPVSAFVEPPSTELVDPSKEPEPFTTAKVITLPVYMAAKTGGVSAGSFEYPVAYAGILAAAPNEDTSTFELLGQTLDATGATVWESRGSELTTSRGSLSAELVAEGVSTVNEFLVESGSGPYSSVFVLIGDGPDSQTEMALVMYRSGPGWVLERGILDTVPRAWPTGTPVWFMSPDFLFADSTQQSAGSSPNYKLLGNTSRGQLSESQAPVLSGTLMDRIHLPLRPANLKVEGVGFGEIDMPSSGTVEVTWARRNRLTEETVVMPWTDGDVTPEAGQTTNLLIVNADTNVEVTRITGETGTSRVLDVAAMFPSGTYPSAIWIVAESERNDFHSLQSHRIKVRLPQSGYGLNYGSYYG